MSKTSEAFNREVERLQAQAIQHSIPKKLKRLVDSKGIDTVHGSKDNPGPAWLPEGCRYYRKCWRFRSDDGLVIERIIADTGERVANPGTVYALVLWHNGKRVFAYAGSEAFMHGEAPECVSGYIQGDWEALLDALDDRDQAEIVAKSQAVLRAERQTKADAFGIDLAKLRSEVAA